MMYASIAGRSSWIDGIFARLHLSKRNIATRAVAHLGDICSSINDAKNNDLHSCAVYVDISGRYAFRQ